MKDLMYIHQKRFSRKELLDNPAILDSYKIGKTIRIENEEYIILEIVEYFYNLLTYNFRLDLLVQHIEKTLEKKIPTSNCRNNLEQINHVKITKNIDNISSNINDIVVGKIFKIDGQLNRIKKINDMTISINESNEALLIIYIQKELILPLNSKIVENQKKSIKNPKFTVHFNDE